MEDRKWKMVSGRGKMGCKSWKKRDWNWMDFAGKWANRGKIIIYYNKNRYNILYQIGHFFAKLGLGLFFQKGFLLDTNLPSSTRLYVLPQKTAGGGQRRVEQVSRRKEGRVSGYQVNRVQVTRGTGNQGKNRG